MPNHLSELIRGTLFWGGILFFLFFEWTIPYRAGSVSKVKRWLDNLGLAVFNTIVLNIIFSSFIINTTAHVTEHQFGILNVWVLPYWLKTMITVLFMDFMLYVWHLLNHEIPFLWRFHRIHHSDLNLDVSSASRFHIGELSISAVIKIGLIFFLGADLAGIAVFESLLILTSQFHHSSLKVPAGFERLYWILFVPPSMHRIHHSVVIKERNSNYGTIFSIWDRFLETMTSKIDQGRIKIGMGAYSKLSNLRFHHLLIMPFTRAVK